jgi:hypothetical protein
LGFLIEEQIKSRADQRLRAEHLHDLKTSDRHAGRIFAGRNGVVVRLSIETARLA